jgi:uncharacterized protein (TIGR03435 family)
MIPIRRPASRQSEPANPHASVALLVTRIVAAMVLAVLSFGAATIRAHAQTPSNDSGQWQGTTEGPSPLRIVLLLNGAGGKQGVVYLLDGENAEWPHATSSLETTKDHLLFSVANIQVGFSGAFSPDGALSGIWTTHGNKVPLKLVHVTGDAAWALPQLDASMPVSADPTFEVATIRPTDPDVHNNGFELNGNRFRAVNETLRDLLCFAYDIHRAQVLEAPGWVSSDRWTIDSIADIPGRPSLPQIRSMYRKLLIERFGLQVESTTREIPVYAIVTTNQPFRATKSAANTSLPDATGDGNNGAHDSRYSNISMEEFASELSYFEDRPVVNHTGLEGRYDFRLRWSSADAPAAMEADAPPVLFTAIQEQLGLKVEATRSTAPVYVIHHVDRPSAN